MPEYQDIRELARQTATEVTASADRWRRFLRTSAYTYRNLFINQLLIHAQRPEATAVASMDYWNTKAGRWIQRGSHAIAVLDTHADRPRLKLLFDMADTYPLARENPAAMPWMVNEENRSAVYAQLQAENETDNLVNIFTMQAARLFAERRSLFTEARNQSISGSTLEWAGEAERAQLFERIVVQSAIYMACLRCGLPPEGIDQQPFSHIHEFDTPAAAICLGSAMQQVSGRMLADLGRVVRQIDSVAISQQNRDNDAASKNRTQNSPKEAQQDGVHEHERLSGPEPDRSEPQPGNAGQIRADAQGVPATEPAAAVRADAGQRRAGAGFEQPGAGDAPPGGADHAAPDPPEPRPRPQDRPAGLDAVDERPENAGGGAGHAGAVQPVSPQPNIPPEAESEKSPSAIFMADYSKVKAQHPDDIVLYRVGDFFEMYSEDAEAVAKLLDLALTSRAIPGAKRVTLCGIPAYRLEQCMELIRKKYSVTISDVEQQSGERRTYSLRSLDHSAEQAIKATEALGQLSLEAMLPADADCGTDLATEVAAAIGVSSPEEQIANIEKAHEFKVYEAVLDMSGKYITEADITKAMREGSHFKDNKMRIAYHFSQLHSEKENVEFLKKEYGTGGCSWTFADGRGGWLDHDKNGLLLRYGEYNEENSYRRPVKWSEVATRIQQLVQANLYLTPSEKGEYANWLRENHTEKSAAELNTPAIPQAKESAVEKLADAEKETQNAAELPQKRPLALGDVVYLENGKPFTVEEIGFADVQLRDEAFPIISRTVSRRDFARLLATDPRNVELELPASEPSTTSKTVATYPAEQNNLPYDIVIEELHIGPQEQDKTAQEQDEPENTDSPFVAQVMADVDALAEPYHYEPINYTAPYHPEIPTGAKEKYAANVAAIRLLKEIEQRVANGGLPANEDEQAVLAKYVGWGGLADAFDPNKSAWAAEYAELKSLLTETEYNAARESTLTAFYTPAEVIHPLYRALERMNVKGGNILEPSMGIGNFFGHKPSSFDQNDARLYGVELDDLTGRIARQLYQKANIQITGFEKAMLPDNFFDCAIGNVPFGDFSVSDRQYDKLHFRIHDYFIAKAIDKVRTGGIIAFVTTSGTLDKKSEEVRKYIAARCDLIGAVRLPNNAFTATAGTKVTSDILFLQKRDRILEQDEPWLHLAETEDGIPINGYFAAHPEMVCGKMQMISGPHGPTPACISTGEPLELLLDHALQNLQATLTPVEIEQTEDAQEQDEVTILADPMVRNFSFTVQDNKIYYRENSVMREVRPGRTIEERIRKLIAMLEQKGLAVFDAWAANFGETVTAIDVACQL